jgi:hypothetical protein
VPPRGRPTPSGHDGSLHSLHTPALSISDKVSATNGLSPATSDEHTVVGRQSPGEGSSPSGPQREGSEIIQPRATQDGLVLRAGEAPQFRSVYDMV